NRMLLILLNKTGYCMRLSRMIDHIKPLFRPKSDQQFSHSLGTERTYLLSRRSAQTNSLKPGCFIASSAVF
ncbi:hypothetical protein, partial [Citrobacter freundii]|uniref:hypothetical protein n=1 Tax=Citrobacter freundii TaxID=546 RepID=UPI00334A2216